MTMTCDFVPGIHEAEFVESETVCVVGEWEIDRSVWSDGIWFDAVWGETIIDTFFDLDDAVAYCETH